MVVRGGLVDSVLDSQSCTRFGVQLPAQIRDSQTVSRDPQWLPKPSRVGGENAICNNNTTVMTSDSLTTNKTGPLSHDFTGAN